MKALMLVVAGSLAFIPSVATAATETYVSADGRDGAPCTVRRPCRTLQAALGVTDPGGLIVVLDSGTFSTEHLDIRQSVRISAAPGVLAHLSPLPALGIALSVNAGPDDEVVLQGLTLSTTSTATPLNGIVFNSGRLLRIERCHISGFPTKGILTLSSGRLVVEDTVVRGSFVGISLDAPTKASLDGVRVEENEFGLVSGLGARATVRRCVATGNSSVGLLASTISSAPQPELTVEDCVVTHNGTGIEVRDGSVLRLAGSTVTNNVTGLRQSGTGVLESRGTSTVRGNGTDVAGAVTPISGE